MFGELPSWGLYVRHVAGLEMKNVRLGIRENDFRPAYVFDDVKDLTLNGGSITSLSKERQVILKDTKKVQIMAVKVDGYDLKKVAAYGTNSGISGVELIK